MRRFTAAAVGLLLSAALCSGTLVPGFADDTPGRPSVVPPTSPGDPCQPGPLYVPGTSFGPVAVGMPLGNVERVLGRARSVENRQYGGHQWTRMRVAGFDVLARDNVVSAVNLAQMRPVPVRTRCGTLVNRPLSLPVDFLEQSYGAPSASLLLNGIRYWLYNALGLLAAAPYGVPYVQMLLIYPGGGYCGVAPVLVLFGLYSPDTERSARCVPNTGPGER